MTAYYYGEVRKAEAKDFPFVAVISDGRGKDIAVFPSRTWLEAEQRIDEAFAAVEAKRDGSRRAAVRH